MKLKDGTSILDTIARIHARTASVNMKTDALTGTFEYIESRLQGCGLEVWWSDGPRIAATVVEDANPTKRRWFIIGYAKLGNEWRLGARVCTQFVDDEPDRAEPIALARAPRRVRIEAADHLHGLLEKLDEELARVEAALDRANEIAAANA